MGIQVIQRDFLNSQVQRSIFHLLEENILCSMCSVDGSRAHANTAYFAFSDQLELFFYSYPDSRHAKNLRRNSSMALTIFSSTQTWGKPDRGLQLFGTCREAKGRLATKAERVYCRRFPGFKRWKKTLEIEDGRFKLRPFRFVPRRLKILDEPEFGAGVFVATVVKRKH